jgi:hypothetical protein
LNEEKGVAALKDFDGCLAARYMERIYVVSFVDRAPLVSAIWADRQFRELHMRFCGYNDKNVPLVEIVARFELFRR